MQENIHELLNKELSRRQFLTQVFLSLAAIVGAGSLLKLFNNKPPLQKNDTVQSAKSSTYGGSDYGGTPHA